MLEISDAVSEIVEAYIAHRFDEIRRIRHEVSQELGHNPRQIVDYYAELQHSVVARTVNLSGASPVERASDCAEARDNTTPQGTVE